MKKMVHKCSFCNDIIENEQVMLDLKGNEYCIHCAHEKLFSWQDNNIEKISSRMRDIFG